MALPWRQVVGALALGQLIALLITGPAAPPGSRRGRRVVLTSAVACTFGWRPVWPAGTGVTSELLAREAQVALPGTQSLLNYALLVLVYPAFVLLRRRREARRLGRAPAPVTAWLAGDWWKYAAVAFLDVQANYLVVLSYQYTTVASVMLINCVSIPVVMVGSRWLFGTRYNQRQLAGVALCIVGVLLVVLSDLVGQGGSSVGS